MQLSCGHRGMTKGSPKCLCRGVLPTQGQLLRDPKAQLWVQPGLMLYSLTCSWGRTHITDRETHYKNQVQHARAHRDTIQLLQLGHSFKHTRAGGLRRQDPCNTQITMWARQPSPQHMTKTCHTHTEGCPHPACLWFGEYETSLLLGAETNPAEGAAPGGLLCKSPGGSCDSQQGAQPWWVRASCRH